MILLIICSLVLFCYWLADIIEIFGIKIKGRDLWK